MNVAAVVDFVVVVLSVLVVTVAGLVVCGWLLALLLHESATAAVLGHAVRAPSTLGTFLRGFTWGHARQLDKVAGELLGRASAAGGRPRRRTGDD